MAAPFRPSNYLRLPTLDAPGAVSLASSLEAATRDAQGKPRPLPETISEALEEMRRERVALSAELGDVAINPPVIRAADLLEDAAVGAVHDILVGWERVAGHFALGDLARELRQRLFADGLQFITIAPREEWAVVQSKLEAIEREGLEARLAQLGLAPLLGYLREVHLNYGVAVGATARPQAIVSPRVGERLDALEESMRLYLVAVVGSVRKSRPETLEFARLLLEPVDAWRRARRRPLRGADEDGET